MYVGNGCWTFHIDRDRTVTTLGNEKNEFRISVVTRNRLGRKPWPPGAVARSVRYACDMPTVLLKIDLFWLVRSDRE